MGELHLDVLVDRMLREFRVQANVGRPRVAYRETITRPVTKVNYKYVKQSGGHGQYGMLFSTWNRWSAAAGSCLKIKLSGGSIPQEYIPAVEKGVGSR